MEAARAMAQGIENADHDAEVRCLPMADGGEGTARALVDATGGSMHAVPVHDPLGRPVEGHFGLLADGTTAVVETAEASGLALLEAKKRNPLIASSYGTGELILAAVRSGAKRIIVGLGGSATNDAGAGLLQALGVRLLVCFVKLGSAFCAVFFRSVGSGFSAGCAVSAAACLRCVGYLVMRACSLR